MKGAVLHDIGKIGIPNNVLLEMENWMNLNEK